MAGGVADGEAQRAGVSPGSSSLSPSTPWFGLGVITPSLSSTRHCLPRLEISCDPPKSRQGPSLTPRCCLRPPMTPWSSTVAIYNAPGLAWGPAMTPPTPSWWLVTPPLDGPGARYDPLGHPHPLQNLHEDSARIPEGLHHHVGGPGCWPLPDQGYVMEEEGVPGDQETLGVVLGT